MSYGVKNIKKGDIFTESEYGMTVTLYATEDATRVEKTNKKVAGYICHAARILKDNTLSENTVEYFAADDYGAYAPDITFIKNELRKE